MREVWNVKIYSMKDGRKDVYETNADNEVELARIVMSFKPKRGYEVVKMVMEREWWLV